MSDPSDRSVEEIAAERAESDRALRDVGLKATSARRKVLELFEQSGERHLSAETVYQKLVASGEHVSLATVYRVLGQFESVGLLTRHQLESAKLKPASMSNAGSVYELSRLGDHNHLICVECGAMTCFEDEMIDRRQRELAKQHGFRLRDYSLFTYVECLDGDCKNRR